MVKPAQGIDIRPVPFESDVVPDSGKTCTLISPAFYRFESDVVPDSGKTCSRER